mgnify:CR=1 FL=1
MKQQRLHIKLGDQRTTVTVDTILSAMLAIKLGQEPDDTRAVREWLQARLPDKIGTDKGIGKKASQHARVLLIEEIADTKVSAAYDEWVIQAR